MFGERYHAHLLTTPTEAARAVRYVLENERVHSGRQGPKPLDGAERYTSTFWRGYRPPLVREPEWWMLRVGAAGPPKAA